MFYRFLSILVATVSMTASAQVERHQALFMGVQEKAYQTPAGPLTSFPPSQPWRDIRQNLQSEGRHLYPGSVILAQRASVISKEVAAPVREANLIFVAGEPTHYANQAIDGWTFTLSVLLQNGRVLDIEFDSKLHDLVFLDEAANRLRMNKAEAVRLGELTRYKLAPLVRGHSPIQDVELVLRPFTLVPHKSFSRVKSANDNPPFSIRSLPAVVFSGVSQVQEFLNVTSSCSFYLNDFLMTGQIF